MMVCVTLGMNKPLGGLLAAVNTLRHADSVIRVACQFQARQTGDAIFDSSNTLQVADVVLGHRAFESLNPAEQRIAAEAYETSELLGDDLP